jgi:DNA recombination-dependent growth factor C
MGLINGSITYKLYRIDDKLPKDLKDTMVTNLAKFAFREINPKTNPEMSIGWVNVFNPIDTHLTIEKVMQGKYIILGIRKDRKSLPAALLKAQLNEALRAQIRERRGKKLSREEVASLKETVKEQMLAAVSPTTNLYEAVWNFETQDVYFSAQAGKIAAEFAELFEETFGLALSEVTLPARAEAYVESKGLGITLEEISPAHFGR